MSVTTCWKRSPRRLQDAFFSGFKSILRRRIFGCPTQSLPLSTSVQTPIHKQTNLSRKIIRLTVTSPLHVATGSNERIKTAGSQVDSNQPNQPSVHSSTAAAATAGGSIPRASQSAFDSVGAGFCSSRRLTCSQTGKSHFLQ